MAEKQTFIEKIAEAAQAAEQRDGPPAAGVMAMAALESSYGWTRTALFANNLFGWKATSHSKPGGRASWILACQPTSDPGKRYIVFAQLTESVAFVAGRLGSMSRYAPVTRRYHQDRRAGMPLENAVERWVRGIAAAGYNPLPGYPATVFAIVRNWRHPEVSGSAEDSLLQFSRSAALPGPRAFAALDGEALGPAARAAQQYLRQHLEAARYLSRNCGSPIRDSPGYADREVRRCTHSVTSAGKTLSALTYLMNPSEANLVARIGNACTAVGLGAWAGCGLCLAQLIINRNGGQFPVAGFVIERKQDAGGRGSDPVYLEFRDGVTVLSAERYNFTDSQLSDDAMEHAARATLLSAKSYARIANADRAAYRRAGGRVDVGASPAEDRAVRWPGVIRANELEAQASGHDQLLNGVALGMKNTLAR